MGIDFDAARWERTREAYARWWSGDLERPLIHLTVGGRDPGRPEPALPGQRFAAFYDLSVPAEAIVDRWDYDLSCQRFLGDAFPGIWPNFGPGVLAAFLGACLQPGENTVWFHPEVEGELSDRRWVLDRENVWYRRVESLCRAAMERWGGIVQVGMTDLGGNLDILSTFRPGEKLLFDLYDHPDEVKQATWEAHDLWWRCFEALNEALRPINPGYTAWTPIFSEQPYYMLQCDFCYMISPEMFDEFVKPELAASCKRLTNAFYHLDGPGQLPHLDSLLAIEELKGVQWVPGAGNPDMAHWPEVYRKIRDAGKRIQVFGGLHLLDALAEQLGTLKGVIYIGGTGDEAAARRLLEKYGAA